MKKCFLFSVLFFAVCCIFTFSGCSDSPTTPGPVAITSGTTVDSFTDGDLSSAFYGVTGTWTSGNDSFNGGTSSVTTFGVIADTYSQLALTATAVPSLINSLDGYTALAPGTTYRAYVKVMLDLNKAIDLSSMTKVTFMLSGTNVAGLSYKAFFYNGAGEQVRQTAWTAVPASRTTQTIDLSTIAVPAGSLYSAADVLSSFKSMKLVFQYAAINTTPVGIGIFMDNVAIADNSL